MQLLESTLPVPDGHQVPHVVWQIGRQPRARLVIVHGRGEHGRRYAPVAASLEKDGIECHAIDLRGFGRTVPAGRKPGGLRSFDEYLDEIDAAVTRAKAGGAPVFLLGHSMGGLAAIRWAERAGAGAKTRIEGMILSSPFLEMPKPVTGLKLAIVKLLSLVAPDKALPTKGEPNTRDEACWDAYCKDPLTVKSPTARWLTECLKHQRLAMEEAGKIAIPVLVLQGAADTATRPDASMRFADRSRGDYKEYSDCLHEVLNEPEPDRGRVLADLKAWLQARAQ